MAKYCLSYDVKDSEVWEPDEIKSKLAELIMANGGEGLENFVASTITFEDGEPNSRITFWGGVFLKCKDEIYYYLCQVGRNKQADNLDRNEGDPGLNDNFKDILDDLREDLGEE